MRRVLLFGNSGAGKSTLARQLAQEGLAHLDLDTLAWWPTEPPTRRALADSARALARFTAQHDAWVIEGCYSDLLELVLSQCSELILLNPGVEACLERCRARAWEPHKYPSKAAQDANLGLLLDWVRAYETRADEFSLGRHRRIFEAFSGPKREIGPALSGPEFFEGLETQRAYQARRGSGLAPNELLEQHAFDQLLGDVRDLDVLDLGCGDAGQGRSLLARGCRSYRGIDASSRMIETARSQLEGKQAEVKQGRIEQLELPAASVDLVISRMTLHWLAEVGPAFRQVWRALRPSGRLILSVEHPVLTCSDAARVAGQGRTHWLVDDYFISGPRAVSWFGVTVQKYHRTIEQYFQELLASGFLVEALREGTPSAQYLTDPNELRRRQRVPLLLLLAARRDDSAGVVP